MNEWGIALVGFVGAVLGAVVGFVGIQWQHNANVWHDVRKNVAELLMKGTTIQRAYDSVANPARGINSTPVEETAAAARAMHEIVAYLELVADVKTHSACRGVWETCEGMQRVHALLVADKHAIHAPGWNDVTCEWIDARNRMLDRVRAKRLPSMPLRFRLKNYLALKRYERDHR